MLEALDAAAVRRWCVVAVDVLTAHQREIDDLNVYPVPDGDTGTNLVLTLRAALDAVGSGPDLGTAVTFRTMARGAVLGARGNSGVIVSQILRGVAETIADTVTAGARADGAALGRALVRAAELAWAAVAEPVEGTILSVARAAAEAVTSADPARHLSLHAAVTTAVRGATEALARTPQQLPVLARAGVVDAGGRGLVLLLEALAAVVGDQPVSPPPSIRVARAARANQDLQAPREAGSPAYAYEVQYLLDAPESAVPTLRSALAALGDSLVVVGAGDDHWNVHVHVNDIGTAIELGVEAGRPHRITVSRFADAGRALVDGAHPAPVQRSGVAVVAVAPGEGVADLFTAEGVVVVGGGPDRSPSTAEVLAAIHGTSAASVVLLPNSANVSGVADITAEQARSEGVDVAVVPTRSAVQGLAAIAVHDPDRRFGDNVIAMAEAAAATRWAEITVAGRDALTMVGRCRAGDVLGLAEGDVVLIGPTVAAVALELVDRMLLTGGELVTAIIGADAESGLGALLTRHLAGTRPEVEVSVYDGGQPHYPLLIGVE